MFFDKFFKKNKKYLSCEWIEYGLDFDVGVYGSNVKMCCYLSAPGGGNTMLIEDYRGEKINWRKFFKLKNKYRKIQKSGKVIPDCEGCVFLKEQEWYSEDVIYNVIFDHWTHCNCKCIYCYTEDDKQLYNTLSTYNVLPIIKDMVKRKILRPGGSIGFGGGEPTMLIEFDELINFLLENKFTNIRVPSSGLKYSETISKGIASGQLTVVISVDSSSRETYKNIKQLDGYNIVCNNLIKYSQAQKTPGFVITKYIIIPGMNDTREEIDNWLEFCYKNNILSVVIDVENNWFEKHRKNIPEQVFDLIDYAKQKAAGMNFVRFDICDRARHMIVEREASK